MSIYPKISRAIERCKQQRLRQLLVLESPEPCISSSNLFREIFSELLGFKHAIEPEPVLDINSSENSIVWIAEDLPDWSAKVSSTLHVPIMHCHIARATQLLGSNNRIVVYDAQNKFDVNTLAAAIDTVIGGGLFILCRSAAGVENSFRKNQAINSFYDAFFETCLKDCAASYPSQLIIADIAALDDEFKQIAVDKIGTVVEPQQVAKTAKFELRDSQAVIELEEKGGGASVIHPKMLSIVEANSKQKRFIASVVEQFERSSSASCCLLTSKRGRGKSTALAWLVQAWLEKNPQGMVWLSAPSRKQVAAQYSIWNAYLGKAVSQIEFHSVDELLSRIANRSVESIERLQENTLVVIDEAAAISLALLKHLAELKFPLVLATTTLGYEGSGRGFLLRFRNYLKDTYTVFKEYELTEPLRWSKLDKLEGFVEEISGLGWESKTESIQSNKNKQDLPKIQIRKIDVSSLLTDIELLRSVYGLLVDAHYQTKPSDLQRLLDDPSIHIWLALDEQGQIYGVLQAIQEGGFTSAGRADLANGVVRGVRRPAGNLVAQRLAFYYQDARWCNWHSLRVMRIVVKHSVQRQGVGSLLITAMQNWMQKKGLDYWSSSFGYTKNLEKFWSAQEAKIIYLGSRVDKASGNYNAMVVAPLTIAAILDSVKLQFEREYLARLRYIDTAHVLDMPEEEDMASSCSISSRPSAEANILSAKEQSRLIRFVDRQWDWDSALPLILIALEQIASDNIHESRPAQILLEQFKAFAPNWKKMASYYQLTGKSDLADFIRVFLAQSLRIGAD